MPGDVFKTWQHSDQMTCMTYSHDELAVQICESDTFMLMQIHYTNLLFISCVTGELMCLWHQASL